MTEEMRKRLEEAAENFRGCFLGRMNKCRESKGKEPYSVNNVIIDISLDAAELGYKEGVEHGYKEAIKQATKWLWKQWHQPEFVYISTNLILDFETDMNKLWEE